MVFYCIEISKYELHNDPMQNSYVYIYVCITVVCLYMHIAKQALMMNFWRCLCVTYILHLEAQLTNEKKEMSFIKHGSNISMYIWEAQKAIYQAI